MPRLVKNGLVYGGSSNTDTTFDTTSDNPIANSTVATIVGDTDISGVGDGTITGAIDALSEGSAELTTITYSTWQTYSDEQKAAFVGYVSGVPNQALNASSIAYGNTTVGAELTQINSDLTASGSYNRGKDLTPYVVDGTLWDRIHGTNGFKKYEDIMPWDYIDLGKTITAPSSGGGSLTGTNIVRVAQRGGINPYQFGGTPTDCLVMVPDTHFGMSKMNATNDTTGGYKSSFMVSTILPNINSQLETTNIAGHIVPTNELITNSINASGWGKLGSASGASNKWEWTNGGSDRLATQKCVLMSEMEVYGGTVFSSSGYDTGNACFQLEAFKNSKDAAMPYPIYFWLKDVASAAHFCYANGKNGNANYDGASDVYYVRPRFIIS